MNDPNPHLSCVWSDAHDWDALNANIDVPDAPGYYVFTDYPDKLLPIPSGKRVLYVGIATQSLRDRIKKYKTGDATGLMNLHRGGLMLMLSRAVGQRGGERAPVDPVAATVRLDPDDAGRQPLRLAVRPGLHLDG